MAKRPLVKRWTEQDIARLIELCDGGATLMRAAAALDRASASVQKKARQLGKQFDGVRQVRADLRAAGAIEPTHRRSPR